MSKGEMLDFYKKAIKVYDKALKDIDEGAYKNVAAELELCLTEAVEACLQGIESIETSYEKIN